MKWFCLIVLVTTAVLINSVSLETADHDGFEQCSGECEELQENAAEEIQEMVAEAHEDVRSQCDRSNSCDDKYGGMHEADTGLDSLSDTNRLESSVTTDELQPPNQPEYKSESLGSRAGLNNLEKSDVIVTEESNHWHKRAKDNNMDLIKKGPYGLRPTYDVEAEEFSDADRKDMITGVKLYWFMHDGKKIFRQVGFKTSIDDYRPVPSGVDVGTNEELILQEDEYITDIELITSISTIYYMKFTTNMGNSIEAGINNDAKKHMISSNSGDSKGALLYAKGFQGYWLYEIEFTFYEHGDWLSDTNRLESSVPNEELQSSNQPEYKSENLGSRAGLDNLETSDVIVTEESNHWHKRAKDNNMDLIKKGPYGLRPTYDVEAEEFSDGDRKDMITGVKLYWFMHDGKKIFRQVGFKTYVDEYRPVPSGVDVGTNEELILQKDEYITEIELSTSIASIFYMKFTTNMGNSIEAGINNGANRKVITSNSGDNKGALLYAKGFQGYWLYEIEFTFYEHGGL